MNTLLISYLAGAMDSDGWFMIHHYHHNPKWNDIYTERIGLKQVTPQIPNLLLQNFGGYIYKVKPSTPNGKMLYSFDCRGALAVKACEALLPHLVIKRRQAELIIEFSKTRENNCQTISQWFQREFPNWQTMKLITTKEAQKILGYENPNSIYQAIYTGTLLSIPHNRSGRKSIPCIPMSLVERLSKLNFPTNRRKTLPPELVAWRERLHREVKNLNKVGLV